VAVTAGVQACGFDLLTGSGHSGQPYPSLASLGRAALAPVVSTADCGVPMATGPAGPPVFGNVSAARIDGSGKVFFGAGGSPAGHESVRSVTLDGTLVTLLELGEALVHEGRSYRVTLIPSVPSIQDTVESDGSPSRTLRLADSGDAVAVVRLSETREGGGTERSALATLLRLRPRP